VEGRDLAKSFDVPFFESSAKSRINVEEAFYELVRAIVLCFAFMRIAFQLFDAAGTGACRFEKSAVSLPPRPVHLPLLLLKRKQKRKDAVSCRLSPGICLKQPTSQHKSIRLSEFEVWNLPIL